MNNQRILVVDDEEKMRQVLEIMLKQMGLDVVTAENGKDALEKFHIEDIDLIISDLKMPLMGGVELLGALRSNGFSVPIIIMTAYGTIDSAVEAMKLGASNYIVRPFDVDVLEIAINKIFNERRLLSQNDFLQKEVNKGWGEFIGNSFAIQKIYQQIKQVAPNKTTALVTGETGTGKELVARAIHQQSPRAKNIFVPINCAAIPSEIIESELFGYDKGAFSGAIANRIGKFELADGGTIFLDELVEMPIGLQAKLLRVLQENVVQRLGSNREIKIDVRVIAATNRDPLEAIREGKLREDLYYRLNVFNIHLPPLRERKEDIPLLAEEIIKKYGKQFTFAQDAMDALVSYDWPGNVRELSNVVERSTVISESNVVHSKDLSLDVKHSQKDALDLSIKYSTLNLAMATAELERDLIKQALQEVNGNKTKAAKLLDISERTFWYKLKKLGMEK